MSSTYYRSFCQISSSHCDEVQQPPKETLLPKAQPWNDSTPRSFNESTNEETKKPPMERKKELPETELCETEVCNMSEKESKLVLEFINQIDEKNQHIM